jgi:hypothetical protein
MTLLEQYGRIRAHKYPLARMDSASKRVNELITFPLRRNPLDDGLVSGFSALLASTLPERTEDRSCCWQEYSVYPSLHVDGRLFQSSKPVVIPFFPFFQFHSDN